MTGRCHDFATEGGRIKTLDLKILEKITKIGNSHNINYDIDFINVLELVSGLMSL